MKKLYSLMLLLAFFISLGFKASAYEVTYKWNIPGAIELHEKSAAGALIELADDATEYTYSGTESGSFYAIAKPGYIITKIVAAGVEQKVPAPSNYGSAWGPFITESNASKYSPAEITLEEVEYNIPMKLTIDNGANDIYMQYGPLNKRLDIKNGEQTIYFSKYDTNCYIGGQNGLASADIYNVEVSGTKLTLPYAWSTQYSFTPVENAEIKIRAYEGDEVVKNQYVLSFEAPEGAIASVFNRTTLKIVTDLTEENLTFNEDDRIQINFNPEFSVTALTVNGEDYLEELYSNNILFNITGNTTVKVEGTVKQYGTVTFNAYVINPEGVKLYQGGYQQNLFTGSATETTTEDITVGGITFPAGTTCILHPEASEKNPKIFVEANEGWYIKTVLAPESLGSAKYDVWSSAIESTTNGKTFYVVAEKYETPAILDLIVPASGYMFKCNTALAQNWDNPLPQYSLQEGRNTINYLPGYHDPFIFSFTDESMSLYVDGVAQQADENGRYQVNPVYDAATGVYSTAIVFASTPKNVALTFKGEAIASSDIYYGTARKAVTLDANNRTTVLPGMVLGFKLPAGCQAVAATQTGTPKVYTAADADASGYIVLAPEAATVVTIEKAATTANLVPLTLTPETGTVARNISTIKMMMPVLENYEHSYYINPDDLAKITLTPENGDAVTPAGLGDVSMTMDETMFVFPLQFDPAVTEAGKYTLDIPAGIIYETAWDDASKSFVKVDGGNANAAAAAEYTVDPNAETAFSTYELTPAAGNVESIEMILLNFPKVPLTFSATYPETVEITNGTTTYTCALGFDWNQETLCFKIMPVTEDYEPVVITEEGEWTLTIPEGSIGLEAETCPLIEAKYIIAAAEPSYILDPSTDSTVFNLGTIRVTFKNASEITYNDEIITLEGNDFSTETDYVDYDGNVAALYFTAPEEAGDYTLTIPAGAFTVDGNPSELISAVYHFEPAYVLNPAPMSQIENVSDITISFPAFTNVEFVGASYQVLAMAGQSSAMFLEVTPVEGADVPTFRFSPADETAKLSNGYISLKIEEGVFSLDGADSPAITAYYNLSGPVSTDWTVSPDKCIIYDEYFIGGAIVFDESVSVSKGENYDAITISLNDSPLSLTENVGIESNYFMINVFENIALGQLKVHIPAGALSLSGTPCTEIDYAWDVIENKTFDYVVTPAEGDVKDLSTVKVEFPTATSASVFMESGAFLRSTDYDYKCSFSGVIEPVEGAEHPTFKITFSNDYGTPTRLTDYVLQIPEQTFTIDDYYASSEIRVNYTLQEPSGIEDIIAGENGEVVIYTLQGIKVNAEWKNLPAGFYIVNGKKIRKND